MKKESQVLGMIYVILAGICWGMISIFVRKLNSIGFDSYNIMCIRAWFSAGMLFVLFLIKDRNLFKISFKDIWMFFGTGIFSLTFFTYCYFTSIVRSGAAISVVLLYTSPIFVMLMSAVVFREKITVKKIVALVLTFAGCVLMAGMLSVSGRLSIGSLLLGIGAGFGYALYSIFAGIAVKKYSSLTITFYTMLFSGVFLPVIQDMGEFTRLIIDNYGNALWAMIGISLICTVIPYVAYTAGLQRMEAGKASVLVTVEPLVGTVLGFAVYHENMNWMKITGMILIFISVVLLSIQDMKSFNLSNLKKGENL